MPPGDRTDLASWLWCWDDTSASPKLSTSGSPPQERGANRKDGWWLQNLMTSKIVPTSCAKHLMKRSLFSLQNPASNGGAKKPLTLEKPYVSKRELKPLPLRRTLRLPWSCGHRLRCWWPWAAGVGHRISLRGETQSGELGGRAGAGGPLACC